MHSVDWQLLIERYGRYRAANNKIMAFVLRCIADTCAVLYWGDAYRIELNKSSKYVLNSNEFKFKFTWKLSAAVITCWKQDCWKDLKRNETKPPPLFKKWSNNETLIISLEICTVKVSCWRWRHEHWTDPTVHLWGCVRSVHTTFEHTAKAL